MKSKRATCLGIILGLGLFGFISRVDACSVVYYIDKHTGKIFVVNNEDYWYDVDTYIRIIPASGKHLARLWYGWDNFAQGGVNEAGLFFDGAVTPEQTVPDGYGSPKSNLGDEILRSCYTVEEALGFMEQKKIALSDAHMMIGDSTGNVIGGAVQLPGKNESGRVGGTLYSSFINISDMEFVLVYKLDNQKLTRLDLSDEFAKKRKQKIKL